MNGNIFARMTGTKRNLLALLASSAMLTAGCANMANRASDVDALTTSATLGGRVYGGNQPVAGATVNLYYAGQGSTPASLVATTTTAADGSGSFSFGAITCPSSNPLVYVVAKGGNTLNNGDSGVDNSAAAFIAVYGVCSTLSTTPFVNMTEVTTAATMAAVQQFFNPANELLAADGTGQEKVIIINLPKTIALLVNAANGTAVASTVIPGSGHGVSGVTVTATPEVAKLNTIANILSACVNNASASATACTTLFANAAPPSPSVTNLPTETFTPATDVLQAAYYMFTNPTNGSTANLANVFSLAAGAGAPYQPSLASQPSDWTVAINYASTSTCGTGSGGFISQPYDINIDSADNIWIANSQASSGNLSELSLTGAAANCVFLGGGSNGGATIDINGNIWQATTASNDIYRYTPATGAVLDFPTAAPSLGVTSDGSGNVYFSSSNGKLYQIPLGSAAKTAVAPVEISSVVGPNPIRLMPDYLGVGNPSDIFVSSGSTFISMVSPGTSGANVDNGFSTTIITTGIDSYGVTLTHNNGVFVSSQGTDNYVTYLANTKTGYAAQWTTAGGFAGLNTPTSLTIDGANNVWVPNNTNSSVTVGGVTQTIGSVSEISAAGNALSMAPTGFQKDPTFLASGRASVVDQAGNVWIVGDGVAGSPSNYITEIVGAGVPIYQPYAYGLLNGRFQQVP